MRRQPFAGTAVQETWRARVADRWSALCTGAELTPNHDDDFTISETKASNMVDAIKLSQKQVDKPGNASDARVRRPPERASRRAGLI